jgi:hypothetical protein
MTGRGPRAQSGQRNPTDVVLAHRVQIGLPQRLQRKRVGVLGWFAQRSSPSSGRSGLSAVALIGGLLVKSVHSHGMAAHRRTYTMQV